MKRVLTTLALGLAVGTFGFTGTATADDNVDCNSTVEVQDGRTADSLAGVCVDDLGYIEAGATTGGEAYVVASSDELGYVGLSNYESGSSACRTASGPDGNEGGTGTNSGGCVGTNNNAIPVPGSDLVPTPVCGDDTGPWYDTTRDGCRSDQEDVNQAVDTVLDLIP